MTDDVPALPEPAPAFARHFTDPLYDAVGVDMAPFGSDEGSDLLWTWRERREELGSASTLATVLACKPSEVASCAGPMTGVDGIETAMFITSAAFVLLRLVGHLDEDDRQLAVQALNFRIRMLHDADPAPSGPPPVLLKQRDDLASWRNPGS